MASEYEFQSLERDIKQLERTYDKFDTKKNSSISRVKNAKFNEREYGKAEIEKKVKRIVDSGKSDINRQYSTYINSINRKLHDSLERIKQKARSANAEISRNVTRLNLLTELNLLFSDKDYVTIMDQTSFLSKERNSSDSVTNYFLLLRFESYYKICASKISKCTENDLVYFRNYINECIDVNSVRHLELAYVQYFCACVSVLKNSTISQETTYELLKDSLRCYSNFGDDEKHNYYENYKELYFRFKILFNELSQSSYSAFDLNGVKNYLSDAQILTKSDIENDFFRSFDDSVYSIFCYVKEKYETADQDDLLKAINETKTMFDSKYQHDYILFWISTFGTKTFDNIIIDAFMDQFISLKSNLFLTNINIVASLLSADLKEENFARLFISLTTRIVAYVIDNSDGINLYHFLIISLSLNLNYNLLIASKNVDSNVTKEYRVFAEIVFAIVQGNIKLCAGLENAFQVDALYSDISMFLFNKPPKTSISSIKKPSTVDKETKILFISLADAKKKKKRKVVLFAVGGTLLIAIAIVIVLVAIL